MVSAVVLVNTNVGEESKVLQSVKNLQEVEEVHALWGVYDLFVKMNSNSVDGLKEKITSGLRQVEGVSNVLTLMIMENPA